MLFSIQIRFIISDNNNGQHSLQVSVPISTNKFYHVAATYDSLSYIMKLYLDGTLLGESHLKQMSMAVTSMPMLIGAYLASAGATARSFFNGVIDEVMIFNGVLSSHEISCLANY